MTLATIQHVLTSETLYCFKPIKKSKSKLLTELHLITNAKFSFLFHVKINLNRHRLIRFQFDASYLWQNP